MLFLYAGKAQIFFLNIAQLPLYDAGNSIFWYKCSLSIFRYFYGYAVVGAEGMPKQKFFCGNAENFKKVP